ncbi:ribonuclease E inhibitor RraB [Microbulbifer sp. EKSA008]|uniref:ribonuclease E inhibitor RraB n=1 Tax=Microbulbifer sp. EKSA008 TaxID=3243367 RepID=UPI0040429644
MLIYLFFLARAVFSSWDILTSDIMWLLLNTLLGNLRIMSIISKLMEATEADTDVLHRLDSSGDDFSKFREVDFTFKCDSKEKAVTVAGFLGDFQYGTTNFIDEEQPYIVQVLIDMPVTQNILLCVSGFMTCIGELYGVEVEGWGCIAQNGT